MDSTATTEHTGPAASPAEQDRDVARAPVHPLSEAPPLSTLVAAGAMLSLVVHGLLLPTYGETGDHGLWLAVGRWGDFGRNLAAVAGLISFAVGLRGFVVHNHHLRPERRLLLVFFGMLFAGTMIVAMVSERGTRSGEMVWLALGEANLVCVTVSVSVLGLAPGRGTWLLTFGTSCMVLFGLTARVLELVALRLGSWAVETRDMTEALGEVGYVLVLLVGAAWARPRGSSRRDSLAKLSGLAVFGAVAALFVLGAMGSDNEFQLLLYHTQRLRLLLEVAPLVYLAPIALACGVGVAGALASDPIRAQGGLGLLSLVAAGYAPRAPFGLLVLTVGVCLLARAALASSWRVER